MKQQILLFMCVCRKIAETFDILNFKSLNHKCLILEKKQNLSTFPIEVKDFIKFSSYVQIDCSVLLKFKNDLLNHISITISKLMIIKKRNFT